MNRLLSTRTAVLRRLQRRLLLQARRLGRALADVDHAIACRRGT